MSNDPKPARPSQVTMAATMTVVGSALMVFGLFETMGSLPSPEMRTAIDDFLAKPPGDGMGVDSSQIVSGLRVLGFGAGALAAIAFVLGIFSLQGHRGARVGLAVTAALMLVTVPLTGMMPVLVTVAVALLWSRPARAWFDGVTPEAASAAKTAASAASSTPPSTPPSTPSSMWHANESDRPAMSQGWQSGSSASPSQPLPADQQSSQQPSQQSSAQGQQYWTPPARDTNGRRPLTVTIACVLTWLGAGGMAALMVLAMIVFAASQSQFIDEFRDGIGNTDLSLTDGDIVALAWSVIGVMLVWSLIALGLAVLAFRRSKVGRVLLTVSAGFTVLFSLLAIASLVAIVPLLMGLGVVILLFVGGANDWYAGRAAQGGHPGYPAGYDAGYYPPPAGYPGYGDPGQYGPPAYGPPSYGQPPYGQAPYGQPTYGQPTYGQPPYPPQDPWGYPPQQPQQAPQPPAPQQPAPQQPADSGQPPEQQAPQPEADRQEPGQQAPPPEGPPGGDQGRGQKPPRAW